MLTSAVIIDVNAEQQIILKVNNGLKENWQVVTTKKKVCK